MKAASVPKDLVSLQGFMPKLGNNLGTIRPKYRPKPGTMVDVKAGRTNKIENFGRPTKFPFVEIPPVTRGLPVQPAQRATTEAPSFLGSFKRDGRGKPKTAPLRLPAFGSLVR